MSKTLDEEIDDITDRIEAHIDQGYLMSDKDKRIYREDLKYYIGCHLLDEIDKLHKECNCSRDGYAHWVKLDDIREVFNKLMGVKG